MASKRIEGSKSNSDVLFRITLGLAYGAVLLIGLMCHEMWRDELRAWNIVAHSNSIGDIYTELRYEGHGPLWYIFLYLTSLCSKSPYAMQVVHGLLALAAVGLISFAPFQRFEKVLLSFGYFTLFEYAIISRHYVLTEVCCLICCIAWHKRQTRWGMVYFAIGVALLPLTSVYGIVFGLVWLCVYFRDTESRSAPRRPVAIATAAFLFATVISLSVMIPRSDCNAGPMPWHFALSYTRLIAVLNSTTLGLLPIMGQLEQVWNSYTTYDSVVTAAGGVLLLVGTVWHLRRYPDALLFWCLAATGLMLFAYVKYIGTYRHFGHFYLALLCSMWLRRGGSPSTVQRRVSPLLLFILLCQLLAGVRAYLMDFNRPFSGAREAAEFIQFHYPKTIVLEDWYPTGEGLAGYLNRPIAFPRNSHIGYFSPQRGPVGSGKLQDITEAAYYAAESSKSEVLLVLSYWRPPQSVAPEYKIRKVYATSADAIVNEEIFHIYSILPGVVKRD